MDIFKEITDRIITQMESGEIPWEKPWISAGQCISHSTGKPYSLLNQMLLNRPGEYLTYKQCIAEGGHVRRGAKSSMVVFWKWLKVEDDKTHEEKEVPLLKYYNVFHIDHCGLETARSFRNNAAYIQNWLQVLRNDKCFIVSASAKAEKVVNLILRRAV